MCRSAMRACLRTRSRGWRQSRACVLRWARPGVRGSAQITGWRRWRAGRWSFTSRACTIVRAAGGNDAMRSMTGFGRTQLERGGTQVVAEVRSLNQRFFELKLNLPRGWGEHESEIKKIVQGAV